MSEQAPRQTQYIPVEDWPQANTAVTEVTGGQPYSLGSGYDYPQPFAVFSKDAWSGDGMGYRVWSTQKRQVHELYAHIDIVGKQKGTQ